MIEDVRCADSSYGGDINYNGNIVIIGIFNGDYNGNAGCNRDVLR
jgi:hypothetical protein